MDTIVVRSPPLHPAQFLLINVALLPRTLISEIANGFFIENGVRLNSFGTPFRKILFPLVNPVTPAPSGSCKIGLFNGLRTSMFDLNIRTTAHWTKRRPFFFLDGFFLFFFGNEFLVIVVVVYNGIIGFINAIIV